MLVCCWLCLKYCVASLTAQVPVEIPWAGRPTTFTGGVGRFHLHASVTPAAAPLGTILQFRLMIQGTGSLETVGPPDLRKFRSITAAFEIVGDPQSRIDAERKTFEYSLRTLRAEVRAVPGVSLTSFVPETRRFETVMSLAVPIMVLPPEVLQPDAIPAALPVPKSVHAEHDWGALIVWLGCLAVLAALGMAWRRELRPRKPSLRKAPAQVPVDALVFLDDVTSAWHELGRQLGLAPGQCTLIEILGRIPGIHGGAGLALAEQLRALDRQRFRDGAAAADLVVRIHQATDCLHDLLRPPMPISAAELPT